MVDLKSLVRPNILTLKSYSNARVEFSGKAKIWLNANESPLENGLNRYPDPTCKELRYTFAQEKNIQPNQLVFGNGSDELIDLIQRIFGRPGQDKIMQFSPTFGMYQVAASINNLEVITVPLNDCFHLDTEATISKIEEESPKIIFICNPNNPTGNTLHKSAILEILKTNCIIVIDEAYADFTNEPSWTNEIAEFKNLIVLQTFSKARGLAAARLGIAISNPEIIEIINQVKMPYNVSKLTQEVALNSLKTDFKENVTMLINEKIKLEKKLAEIDEVIKIYPSDANFLLVKFSDANAIYSKLLSSGLVTRNRDKVIKNCLRITVGLPKENQALINLLQGKEIEKFNHRVGTVQRITNETEVFISVNLDDNSDTKIHTGIGFYDHMLDQISKHGKVGLKIQVSGDVDIDEHHTIEDTAITLGEAFLKAIGNKRGIERYGYMLPMDDCLAQVAIDFGGRAWLKWDVQFNRENVGEMPTEMFYHFFKSFSDAAKCNINIKAEGDNEHHKIEAIFKAFARAIKMAIKVEGDDLPSTKGIL